MLTRLYRHRLSTLIFAILLGISLSIELVLDDYVSTSIMPIQDAIIDLAYISLTVGVCLFVALLVALLFAALTRSFLWFFTWVLVFFIPLQLLELLSPSFFAYMHKEFYLGIWLVSVLLAVLSTRLLGSTRFARKYKKDLKFDGVFTVDITPKDVWEMLVPLPEFQETLFDTSISGIEPLDPNRHSYKVYTSTSGQQKPDRMVFTKLEPFTAFATQSLRLDMYGNEVKIIENYRIVPNGDQTTIFVSETHIGMNLLDWLWNNFQSSGGDYLDGFAAYCNGKRDYSMRGVGRFKRSLKKP